MMNRVSPRLKVDRPARMLAWAGVGFSALALLAVATTGAVPPGKVAVSSVEAPTGFDNKTNGFEDQAAFDDDSKTFQEIDTIAKGLGPVYNATSCVDCHQNPITGGSSQVVEIRAGHRTFNPDDSSPRKIQFEEPVGGSVVQQRAIDPAIQEAVQPEDDVRTFRTSNTLLGNGFVEVIPHEEFLKLRDDQRQWGMEGFAVAVPVPVEAKLGADKKTTTFVFVERLGRFGWKCQEASLLNFSAGAYITEIGITNPMNMEEMKSNGRDVSKFDAVKEPEDQVQDDDSTKPDHPFGNDVEAFTRFMRSTKASPRDSDLVAKRDVAEGESLFRNNKALGCAVCHQPDYTTPQAGTAILTLDGKRGSDMLTVPDALGGKVIHPYSDFLLHDVGTGDGIAQTQHADLPSRDQQYLQKIPQRDPNLVGDWARRDQRRQGRQEDPQAQPRGRPAHRRQGPHGPPLGTPDATATDARRLSLTVDDAIRRHNGQAEGVRLKYEALSSGQRDQLLAFLKSL